MLACILSFAYSLPCIGQEAEVYFPMQVGNRWAYHWNNNVLMGPIKDTPVTFAITKKTDIGGKSYFVFDRFFPSNGAEDVGEHFFRYAQNQIIEYIDGKESVRYDFSGKPWFIEPMRWESQLINKQVKCEVGYHKSDNCYHFHFGLKVADAGWDEVLSPQIGVVSYTSIFIGGIWDSYELVSARVNGVTYGDVAGVKNRGKLAANWAQLKCKSR